MTLAQTTTNGRGGQRGADALARLCAWLRGGPPLDLAEASALAAAIEATIAGRAESLDQALGLRAGVGQRSWQTAQSLSRRDALIREAGERFFRDGSAADRARRLHEALCRYSSTAWSRERLLDGPRPCDVGKAREFFWWILRANPSVLSAHRIRKLLATSCPYSRPAGERMIDS